VGQTVLPTALLALLAWFLFRTTLRPLATLVQATRRVGSAQPQSLPETGPAEVRELIHAFNAMQLRIHELLARGSQTLLAIGHDLRTPLARLQLRLDNAGIDPAAHQEMSRDIDEMRDLLASLQVFVESGTIAPRSSASMWRPWCRHWSMPHRTGARMRSMPGRTVWTWWRARWPCAVPFPT
jgi:signal transduction histidine kinase